MVLRVGFWSHRVLACRVLLAWERSHRDVRSHTGHQRTVVGSGGSPASQPPPI